MTSNTGYSRSSSYDTVAKYHVCEIEYGSRTDVAISGGFSLEPGVL